MQEVVVTPNEFRSLLAHNVGKRIKMENQVGTLTGVIHGVDGKHVLVTHVVETRRAKRSGYPYTHPQDHIDRWGTPRRSVQGRRVDGRTVFEWLGNSGGAKVTLKI